MGSEQSSQSNHLRQRAESLSIAIRKPEVPDSAGQATRLQSQDVQPAMTAEQRGVPNHNIVVVADGTFVVKDPDPELTRLRTIPSFLPIIKSSLQATSRMQLQEHDLFARLDHRKLLLLCLRYQEHLKQLSEAVAFDQNALCIRMKEVSHNIQVQQGRLNQQQKKYQKYAEQFQRVTEITATLAKVKTTVDDIVPCLDRLNQLLPDSEQLEPFSLNLQSTSIQTD